jgi:predicted dehydrogenase
MSSERLASRQSGRPRFLVIGCGSIGKRHMGNLRALNAGDILAWDPREDRRHEASTRYDVKSTKTLDEAWKYSPNVAVIATPTSSHLSVAIEAARRGCHLFVEKPLADRLDGLDELLDIVISRRLVTLVGCNMRFHPGLVTIKRLLEEKAVGHVVSARVEVGHYLPDWHPWEDYRETYSALTCLGGGVILDAIHELDYIRWMLGDVRAVACFAGKQSGLDIQTEDTAAILLRFAEGAIGEVHLDYVQREYSRTCQIIGEEGTLRWDYGAGEVRLYSSATRQWDVFRNPPGWEPNTMYVDELRHFMRCLAGEETAALDVFEGARVLEVALAAKEAAATGRVVELEGRPGR